MNLTRRLSSFIRRFSQGLESVSGWVDARNSYAVLFDRAWYLGRNPDVRKAGIDPLDHYLSSGWREGRSPHPLFDPAWYLDNNPDVRAASVEPLGHYLSYGWREGRSPHPLFDPAWYLESNPDVRAAGVEPLGHYLSRGWREGRSPHPQSDPMSLAQAFPEDHPLRLFLEGRLDDPQNIQLDRRQESGPRADNRADQNLHRGQRDGKAPVAPKKQAQAGPGSQAPAARTRAPDAAIGRPASPLIIAGFHRSGTSLVSNLLADAGLFLGRELLGASESNPYGHFEDKRVVEFHDQLLARTGVDWQLREPFLPRVERFDYIWMFNHGVRNSIWSHWGFKDPRVCLFLPYWEVVFPSMSVLYVYRSCIDCVYSLKRRAMKDIARKHAINVNMKFWNDPDLSVRMYLSYAKHSLDFLESYRGNMIVVPLTDLIEGRHIISEINENWGYDLRPLQFDDVYDPESLTLSGPNESIRDPMLLEQIADVESRFLTLAKRPSAPLFSVPNRKPN